MKAKTISALTSMLSLIYVDAGGEAEMLNELKAFLNCSLHFLKHNTPSEDFCFASLEKLARTLRKATDGKSTFEIMRDDAIATVDAQSAQARYYRDFKEVYTIHSSYRMIMALNQIMGHLQKDGTYIQFETEEGYAK